MAPRGFSYAEWFEDRPAQRPGHDVAPQIFRHRPSLYSGVRQPLLSRPCQPCSRAQVRYGISQVAHGMPSKVPTPAGVAPGAAAGGVGAGGAPTSAARRAAVVTGPGMPSAASPLRCWNAATAAAVFGPITPSTTNPAPMTWFRLLWT